MVVLQAERTQVLGLIVIKTTAKIKDRVVRLKKRITGTLKFKNSSVEVDF